MLDTFTRPETVTCVLCRATVSIRKGNKSRFFNHISLDHEVHYDMDLFYAVSFLTQTQKSTVIEIISGKILGGSSDEGNQDGSPDDSSDVSIPNNPVDEVVRDVTPVENNDDFISEQGSVSIQIERSKEGKNKVIDHNGDEAMAEQSPETHKENVLRKPTENLTNEESNSTTAYLQIIKKFYQSQDSIKSKDEHLKEEDKTITPKKKGKIKTGKKGKNLLKKKEKCKECTVMVSRKNMKIHIQLRHRQKPSASDATGHLIVPCSFCEKRLRRDSITRHMTLIHKINSADQRKIRLEEIKTENVDQTNNVGTQQSNADLDKQESSLNDLSQNIDYPFIKSEKIDFASVILDKLKDFDTPKKGEDASRRKIEKKEGSEYKNCNICQKDIKNQYYKKHLYQTHSGGRKDKEVECELCSIQFSRLERLKGHFKSVHKDDMHLLSDNFKAKFEKADCKFICTDCNLPFITKSSLNYHESRKHGTGSFSCQICSHRFSSRWSLQKHQNQCNATS